MFQGKHYSRAIRALILVSDALSRLFYRQLISWAEEERDTTIFNKEILRKLHVLEDTMINHQPFNEEIFHDILDSTKDALEELTVAFIDQRCKKSPTFKFWIEFLEAADILLKFIRAERNADFRLHLTAIKESLPYLKAGGCSNYAKFVPVYLLDMARLKHNNPEI